MKSLARFIFLLSLLGLSWSAVGIARPVYAAPFTAGNLAIYRVGNGADALANTGSPVFIDEYTTAGVLVQSMPLPTTANGDNFPLIASGTAVSEGFITLSENKQYLLLTGYGFTIPCAASCPTTTSATVPRVVARIDVGGNIDTTTALSDFASGGNPRSVVSTNGTDLWIAGGTGGARYTTLGATTSTQLSTAPTNLRHLHIFDGQLYVSANTGTTRFATIGTGLPTTAGQTITNLPNSPTTGSPYGFVLLSLDGAVLGVDTMYVAWDDTNGLQKYSLVGGDWVLNSSIAGATYRGLTAHVNPTTVPPTVTLYATRSNGTQLVSLVDNTGYDADWGTPAVNVLATAATNTAFRGVAFTPGSDPLAVSLLQTGTNTAALPILPFALAFFLLAGASLAIGRRQPA